MADGAMVVDLEETRRYEADPDAIPVDPVEIAADAAKAKPNTATAMMAAAAVAAAAEKTKKTKAKATTAAKEAAAAAGPAKEKKKGEAKKAAAPAEEEEEEEEGGAGAEKGKEKEKEKAVGDDKLVQLPQARIKRIIRADKDVANVASDALLAITRSTNTHIQELFIAALAELTYHEARSEKRKTVQYDDFAKVVKRYDNLEFLREIVPERITVRKAKERKVALEHAAGGVAAAAGADGADADKGADADNGANDPVPS